MKKLFLLIFLLLSIIAFTGCAIPERKGATIEAGNIFLDDNPPSLRVKFPFPISLSKEESGYLDGTDGLSVSYRSYELRTYDSKTIAYIHRQALPYGDGVGSHFTGTDGATIKDKLFFKKFENGFCSINVEKINKNIWVKTTVNRYSGGKNLDMVNVYKLLGNEFSVDYTLGSPTEKNKHIIEEAIEITNGICSQLEEASLKENSPPNKEPSSQISSSEKRYLHVINPMVDSVTLQVTFEKQRACEVFSATLKNELDDLLKDTCFCSSEKVSEDLNYIAALQYKGFGTQLVVETFYFSECEDFLRNVQKDVFDVIQECQIKQDTNKNDALVSFFEEVIESIIATNETVDKANVNNLSSWPMEPSNDTKEIVEGTIRIFDTDTSGNEKLMTLLKDRGLDANAPTIRLALIKAAKNVLARRNIDSSGID